MKVKYLLDTNTFFNILQYIYTDGKADCAENIRKNVAIIKSSTCCISRVTLIEIISVIGKYSRGNNGGKQKCTCVVSDKGELCENYRYTVARAPWKNKATKAWLKLVKDIIDGKSPALSVEVLPINEKILLEAESLIQLALKNNFGSMDSIIASTAKINTDDEIQILTVTSDRGLAAGMQRIDLPLWDAFAC